MDADSSLLPLFPYLRLVILGRQKAYVNLVRRNPSRFSIVALVEGHEQSVNGHERCLSDFYRKATQLCFSLTLSSSGSFIVLGTIAVDVGVSGCEQGVVVLSQSRACTVPKGILALRKFSCRGFFLTH